jgi:hypothetical protein
VAGDGWRIIIDDGDDPRAVCKILPLSDGGYSMVAPYHAAKEGWLYKHTVDYQKHEQSIHLSEAQHFAATDRVKLSHHWDGFVQFSGENPQKIKSGRNPLTGEPKGLAIMSAPIWKPITTGPTFGISAWGMTDFKQVTDTRATDVIFRSTDIYYYRCAPYTFNAYNMEGWIFGAPMWDGVRGTGNDLRLSMHFPLRWNAKRAILEFRVLPLATDDSDCFLGIRINRMCCNLPSPSGFEIGGPSNLRRGEHIAEMLKATYPKDADIDDLFDPESLDYVPDDKSSPDEGA